MPENEMVLYRGADQFHDPDFDARAVYDELLAEERGMCPCRMDYESIERAGIQEEDFWAAMNGTSFGGKDD